MSPATNRCRTARLPQTSSVTADVPPGYETNGIAQLDLYAAITAERRSTSATQDFQEGKMFLWDAIQTTYNRYYDDIPEGSARRVF
jgi:hypothetical protein